MFPGLCMPSIVEKTRQGEQKADPKAGKGENFNGNPIFCSDASALITDCSSIKLLSMLQVQMGVGVANGLIGECSSLISQSESSAWHYGGKEKCLLLESQFVSDLAGRGALDRSEGAEDHPLTLLGGLAQPKRLFKLCAWQ